MSADKSRPRSGSIVTSIAWKLIAILFLLAPAHLFSSACVDAKSPTVARQPSKLPARQAVKTSPKVPAAAATSKQQPNLQKTETSSYAKGAPQFLWHVASENSSVYLLGTLHMVKGSFYPLPSEMEKAFDQSQTLVLEVDLSRSDPATMQRLLLSNGLYPPKGTDSLDKHLSKESKAALTAYLSKGGLPPDAYNKLKPWLVALTITKGELQKMGFQPELGIDQHFLRKARSQEKKVTGLETEEFQINLLAGFSDELQDEMLRLTLLEATDMKKVADDMMAKWRAGDSKGMDELISRDIRKHPDLLPVQEKMLYERNVAMTQKIEDMLKQGGSYFVAVGTGHLVGEKGIVSLLTKNGFKVEQIMVGQALPPRPGAKEPGAPNSHAVPVSSNQTVSADTPVTAGQSEHNAPAGAVKPAATAAEPPADEED